MSFAPIQVNFTEEVQKNYRFYTSLDETQLFSFLSKLICVSMCFCVTRRPRCHFHLLRLPFQKLYRKSIGFIRHWTGLSSLVSSLIDLRFNVFLCN